MLSSDVNILLSFNFSYILLSLLLYIVYMYGIDVNIWILLNLEYSILSMIISISFSPELSEYPLNTTSLNVFIIWVSSLTGTPLESVMIQLYALLGSVNTHLMLLIFKVLLDIFLSSCITESFFMPIILPSTIIDVVISVLIGILEGVYKYVNTLSELDLSARDEPLAEDIALSNLVYRSLYTWSILSLSFSSLEFRLLTLCLL